jgi:glyceraldehyde 3-phosphate dehydrogenase
VHGRFPAQVTTTETTIDVGHGPIAVTAIRNPADLPWGHVDIVMECTGIFTSKEKCQAHLENGASRVLISAPGADADKTIVYGVNHDTLTGNDLVVSNASCTTNCLSPVAKVLNDAIGISKGFMTTIHSYTGDQPTLDTMHKDLYRARAAAMNIIPTSTGAARAVGLVLPELKGKLDGVAIRVPTPNVSLAILNLNLENETTVQELNRYLRDASLDSLLQNQIDYTNSPEVVSSDFVGSTYAGVVDSLATIVDGSRCVLYVWYDNEYGYSCQVVRMVEKIAGLKFPSYPK